MTSENFIVSAINSSPYLSAWKAPIFTVAFMGLAIICAPIQAGLSDIFRRKLSIITALAVSTISLIFIFLYIKKIWIFSPVTLLAISWVLKGVGGNITPVALGGIYDKQKGNLRYSFAWATSAWAFSYCLLAASSYFTSKPSTKFFIYCALLIISIIFFLAFYRDAKKSAHMIELKSEHAEDVSQNPVEKVTEELKFTVKDTTNKYILLTLGPYFLWEVSLYTLVVYLIDYKHSGDSSIIVLIMMAGYLVGISLLFKFRETKDITIIKSGYCISFLSLLPYFALFKFVNSGVLIAACYFFHTIGNALLCPTLLTLLAKERPQHKQGRSYGLADSADTIAYLMANVFIFCYDFFNFNELALVSFSFFTFLISFLFYNRFKNDHKYPLFTK